MLSTLQSTTRRAVQYPARHPAAVPVLATLGWLISLALLLRLPLFAGLLGAALALIGLFLLPGLGWLRLTDQARRWPVLTLPALAFAAGLVPYTAIAAVGLVFTHPAQTPPLLILVVGQVVQTILVGLLWWRLRREGPDAAQAESPAREHGLSAAIVGAVVVMGLAVYLTATVSNYLPLGPQDGWDYANIMQWTADHPGQPSPKEISSRLLLNTWINLKAALTWGTQTPAVDLLMRYLPTPLLLLSFSAVYGLAYEASRRRRVAWFAILAQGLMVLTYVGSNALIGVFATLRLGEDKALTAFILLPIALLWLLRWLRGQGRMPFLWLAATVVVAVLTHPSSLGLLAVIGGGYALLAFAAAPDWRRLRRLAPVTLAALIPLVIVAALAGREEGILGGGITVRTVVTDFAFAANQLLLIGPLELGQYIVHPQMLHPLMDVALVIAVLAVPYWRRSGPRLLLAAILIPAALLFIPFITPLLGQVVTLTVLERFLWLWPVGLACGLALDAALEWLDSHLSEWLPDRRAGRTVSMQAVPLGLAALLILGSVPTIEARWAYHYWFGQTQNIQPAEIQVRDALVELAAAADDGMIDVVPPHRLLPVLVGYTPQIITHTNHRLEGLPIVELGQDEWIHEHHFSVINTLGSPAHPADYVVIQRDVPAAWQMYLRPDRFTPVFEGSYVIFRYAAQPTTQLDALLFNFSSEVERGTSFDAAVWGDYAAALALQGDLPAAPPVIDTVLGWLAFQQGDYAAASAHFAAVLDAAPQSLPLFVVQYVDALSQQGALEEAGRIATDLLPLAQDKQPALAARLGDLARRAGPESPFLGTLDALAFAGNLSNALQKQVLQELLTTDLLKYLSTDDLDALRTVWESIPTGGIRPSAWTVATRMITLRRDLAQAASWLDAVPEVERDEAYWLLRANMALVAGEYDAARAALVEAEAVSLAAAPAVYEADTWYVDLFDGHLATAQGDLEGALAAYQAAQQQAPGNVAVRLYLGAAYEALARWDDAAALYETMAASGGIESYWGYYGLARVYTRTEQDADAAQAFAQGLAQQRIYSPDLPLPTLDNLPTVRSPIGLADQGQLLYGGVTIPHAEVLTRELTPGEAAQMRLCAMPLVVERLSPLWQVQVIQPEGQQRLAEVRAHFPSLPPLQVTCWPLALPMSDFERPEPPTRAQIEVISLEQVFIEGPVVAGWVMQAAPPDEAVPTTPPLADFDGLYRLLDATWEDQAAPGDHLTVEMLWQAEAAPTRDHVFFVHLVDDSGAGISQFDQQPYAGRYPTSTWAAGAVVRLEHTLDLPADLPAGTYQLLAGIYDSDTLDRLPGSADGAALQNGLLPLGTVTVGAP